MSDPQTWGRGVRRRVARRDLPREVLALLTQRDGQGCAACTRLGLTPPLDEPLEIDHKQPISLGGDSHWTNLQVLCRFHNRSKGNRRLQGSRLPTWVPRLVFARRLRLHVLWCNATGRVWEPNDPWLAQQIRALLACEVGS